MKQNILMKQNVMKRFWSKAYISTAILLIGAQSLFFPKLADARELRMNQVSVFGQNNFVEKRLGGGIGYEFHVDDSKKSQSDISSLNIGISFVAGVAGPALYVDEAYLRFGHEDRRVKYSLAVLRNNLQKTPFGLEGSYLFKPFKSFKFMQAGAEVLLGAEAVAMGVPGDGTRMQFSIRPAAEAKFGPAGLGARWHLNWIPGETPLIHDKGLDAFLEYDAGSFDVFLKYGMLSGPGLGKGGRGDVFNYLEFGTKYGF